MLMSRRRTDAFHQRATVHCSHPGWDPSMSQCGGHSRTGDSWPQYRGELVLVGETSVCPQRTVIE